jgi:DNA-binding CsgD family transcriptional regulator
VLGLVVELHRSGEVDRLAPRLRELLDRTERPIDREVLTAHLALALADSGRTSAAAALAADALSTGPTPAGAALLGWALTESELAGARLTRARSACAAIDVTSPSPASILAGLAASWADALSPSQPGRSGTAAGPGEPAARTAAPWPGLAAADLERAALDARSAGRPADQIDAAFRAAEERWSGWHRRGALRCRWAAADAALGGSDKDAAIERLRTVEEEATVLGQRPLVARIRVSLRSAGVRRRPHRGTGRGPLSAREVEVLELVRLGFTSGEAAQALGVAPSTVDTQVESAMRKLGARTRLQAAALAGQLPT